MRFMVLVKEDQPSDTPPDPKMFEKMGKYNEELVKAGVMLAGEGLLPSATGVRVKFEGDKRTVTDGPFAETKELLAGYWLLEAKDRAEVIEWVKRAPFDGGTEIEIRQVAELEDFTDLMTPEQIAAEERLQAELKAKRR